MKADEEPIVVSQTFNASAEAVWNAITVVDEMRRWYFSNIPAFEPQVGFETQFLVTHEGREFPHQWKVTEVIPLKKITYDWRFDNYPGLGLVTFELSSQGDATTLRLTNTVLDDFPDAIPEFTREACSSGWEYFIGQSLKEFLEGKTEAGNMGPGAR
jgi:uncharacterized protein YndB with AHSA1/START domain